MIIAHYAKGGDVLKKSVKTIVWAASAASAAIVAGSVALFKIAVVKRRNYENVWMSETKPQPYEKLHDSDRENVIRGIDFILDHHPKTVYITAKDGLKLCGHLIEQQNANGMFIMFHGYRSDPFTDFAAAVRPIYDMGFSILMVDQRAHGNSNGNHICFGAKERYDVVSWCEYVEKCCPGIPVVLDGVSMGAATVMMAAGLVLPDNVKALICDCGYTSPADICRICMRKWYKLPSFPLLYTSDLLTRAIAHFSFCESDAREALSRNTRPILLVHGTGDDFVPYKMSEQNFAACTMCDAELFLVKGAEHGMSFLVDQAGYMEKMKALLTKAGIQWNQTEQYS